MKLTYLILLFSIYLCQELKKKDVDCDGLVKKYENKLKQNEEDKLHYENCKQQSQIKNQNFLPQHNITETNDEGIIGYFGQTLQNFFNKLEKNQRLKALDTTKITTLINEDLQMNMNNQKNLENK